MVPRREWEHNPGSWTPEAGAQVRTVTWEHLWRDIQPGLVSDLITLPISLAAPPPHRRDATALNRYLLLSKLSQVRVLPGAQYLSSRAHRPSRLANLSALVTGEAITLAGVHRQVRHSGSLSPTAAASPF